MRLYAVERIALRFYEREVSPLYHKIFSNFLDFICLLVFCRGILLFSFLRLYSHSISQTIQYRPDHYPFFTSFILQLLTLYLPSFNHPGDKISKDSKKTSPGAFSNFLMADIDS